MSFLHGILLAGAAALLIPLIIHLLNRRRVQRVAWGAMNLLRRAFAEFGRLGAVARCRAAGYHPIGENYDDPQWFEAFLVPREAQGTVVQITQSEPPPLPWPERFAQRIARGVPEPVVDALEIVQVQHQHCHITRRTMGSLQLGFEPL